MFCPQKVLLCAGLVFITETGYVDCKVQRECLNVLQVNLNLLMTVLEIGISHNF